VSLFSFQDLKMANPPAFRVIFKFSDGTSASTEAYPQLNILAHAQLVERSLQSRCGGQCACGTCRVRIASGAVSAPQEEEKNLLRRVTRSAAGQNLLRLACQCFPEPGADVVVEVPASQFSDARDGK
jgi:ferredoxin